MIRNNTLVIINIDGLRRINENGVCPVEDGVGIDFLHPGRVGTDAVDMTTRTEEGPVEEGCGGVGTGDDNIGGGEDTVVDRFRVVQ
mmetsp:Transcript_32043/g.45555  ORF Transcript_32043/g.45555 Transcript_32043/m.45555 type:complete len:86 (+) Transcript_32043:212-469(+)